MAHPGELAAHDGLQCCIYGHLIGASKAAPVANRL